MILDSLVCPNCGKSNFTIKYATTTALAGETYVQDGKWFSTNPNTETTYCTCRVCKHDFHVEQKGGEIIDIVDDGGAATSYTIETVIPNVNVSFGGETVEYIPKHEKTKEPTTSECMTVIQMLDELKTQIKELQNEVKDLKNEVHSFRVNWWDSPSISKPYVTWDNTNPNSHDWKITCTSNN